MDKTDQKLSQNIHLSHKKSKMNNQSNFSLPDTIKLSNSQKVNRNQLKDTLKREIHQRIQKNEDFENQVREKISILIQLKRKIKV